MPAKETADEEKKPRDEEVERVEERVSQAEQAKVEAEKEAEAVGKRLVALDRSIALEQRARESARKQGTNAEARIDVLEGELQQARKDGAEDGVTNKIGDQIREAQQRIRESRAEVQERAARLDIILLEDQYSVNDVIRIGNITGMVERVSLRVTVVRDFDAVHFIPHGQISSVSNLTHKWSRAVFDVGVAYGENVDEVMDVIRELGKEMRGDPEFGPIILDDLEMLGVDSFGDSSIMIKFFIKTKPLKQWVVRRELNRRIKNKFDELKIEIPFPHRTVYHRVEENQKILPLEQLAKNRNTEAA